MQFCNSQSTIQYFILHTIESTIYRAISIVAHKGLSAYGGHTYSFGNIYLELNFLDKSRQIENVDWFNLKEDDTSVAVIYEPLLPKFWPSLHAFADEDCS